MRKFFNFWNLSGNDPASRAGRAVIFAHIMLVGILLIPRMYALAINTALVVFGNSLFSFLLGIAVMTGVLWVGMGITIRFMVRSLYDTSKDYSVNS